MFDCSFVGYGGYGPPDGWQRGSRIVVVQAGYPGVNQTWIRNEDGTKTVQDDCVKISPQPVCA